MSLLLLQTTQGRRKDVTTEMAPCQKNFSAVDVEAAQTLLQFAQGKPKAVQKPIRKAPHRKAKGPMDEDVDFDDDGEDDGTLQLDEDAEEKGHDKTSKSKKSRQSFPCSWRACSKSYLTTTGLRKHVNSQHTRKMVFSCPVQDCDFVQRPAKETVLRHLRGKHRMIDLPSWKKGADREETTCEQVRVFKKHIGEGADVSLFTGGEMNEAEAEDEDGDVESEEEGDVEAVADQGTGKTAASTSNPENTTLRPIDPYYGHTASLHQTVRAYALALRQEQIGFHLESLVKLLPTDLPNHKQLRDYVNNTTLLETHGRAGIGVRVGLVLIKWLEDFPMVDRSVAARLVREMEKMESLGKAL